MKSLLTLSFIALLALAPSLARAGENVLEYSTGYSSNDGAGTISTSGTENKAIVKTSQAIVAGAQFFNFDASNAKVVMLFDSATVPANGAIPRLSVVLPTAPSATQPSAATLVPPQGGVLFQNGIVWAASTTAKTLTIDTTSGGNVAAQVFFK